MFKILHIPTATFISDLELVNGSDWIDADLVFGSVSAAQKFIDTAGTLVSHSDGSLHLLRGRRSNVSRLIKEHFSVVRSNDV